MIGTIAALLLSAAPVTVSVTASPEELLLGDRVIPVPEEERASGPLGIPLLEEGLRTRGATEFVINSDPETNYWLIKRLQAAALNAGVPRVGLAVGKTGPLWFEPPAKGRQRIAVTAKDTEDELKKKLTQARKKSAQATLVLPNDLMADQVLLLLQLAKKVGIACDLTPASHD